MSNGRFYRGERLKSAKEIQRLFSRNAKAVMAYPLRLVYVPTQTERGNYPLQVAFSVPKRRYKKAVDRNRIRRRCREAFRLHKAALLERLPADAPQYACMIIYVGKEELPYGKIDRKMRQLHQLFLRQITPPSNPESTG